MVEEDQRERGRNLRSEISDALVSCIHPVISLLAYTFRYLIITSALLCSGKGAYHLAFAFRKCIIYEGR